MDKKNNIGVTDLQETLCKALSVTFGEMSFLDVIPAELPSEVPSGQVLSISFQSPVKGYMIFYFPLELKQRIVENIHGDTWENLEPENIDDCLLELLNIAAGNFLRFLGGENKKIHMTFPSVLFDDSEVERIEDFHTFYFDAEGLVFRTSVLITEE